MQILKYLFFLLLLSIVSASIFIASEKGDFYFEKNKEIKAKKNVVFNYVNDYKNWNDFNTWIPKNDSTQINISNKTSGINTFYAWDGKENSGKITTVNIKSADSITQTMKINGVDLKVVWQFKDEANGNTKLICKANGKLGILEKFYSILLGNTKKNIASNFETSLTAIENMLDYEKKKYSIKINGIVNRTETYYLHETFTSYINKIEKNSSIVFSKINQFCKDNNIQTNGNPFIIYHIYDANKEKVKLSFCVPIKSEFTNGLDSSIKSDVLKPFKAVQGILTGDYSHKTKTIDSLQGYFIKNKIPFDSTFSHIEVYSLDKSQSRQPSKWITTFYFPIKQKIKPVKIIEQPAIEEDSIYDKTKPSSIKTVSKTSDLGTNKTEQKTSNNNNINFVTNSNSKKIVPTVIKRKEIIKPANALKPVPVKPVEEDKVKSSSEF